MKKLFSITLSLFVSLFSFSQEDTIDVVSVRRMVNLSEVVVRSDLNVASFIQQITNDITFFNAFINLSILVFTLLNYILMMDKSNDVVATLESNTRQKRIDGCRTMDVLEEKTSGDFYKKVGLWNYYTAEFYAGLF